MPRLQLKISDKPKRIFCPARESVPFGYSVPEFIQFPCYLEDYGTYWQVSVDGVIMYLANLDGIALYKDIVAKIKEYGLDVQTLADFDPYYLGVLDKYSFGQMSSKSADWLKLSCGVVRLVRFETLGDYDPYTLGVLDAYNISGK